MLLLLMLNNISISGIPESIAFGVGGSLIAPTWEGCVYIATYNGLLTLKKCYSDRFVSATFWPAKGVFAAGSASGYIYLFSGSGLLQKVFVGAEYTEAIAPYKDKLLACHTHCGLFEGNETLWSVEVGEVLGKIAILGNKAYVPDSLLDSILILDLDEGKAVDKIYLGEDVYSVAVCNAYLAVAARFHLYLFNSSDMSLIWQKDLNAWDITFDSSCSFIFASLPSENKTVIMDLQGRVVEEISVKGPYGIAAWGSYYIYLAIGSKEGLIIESFKKEELRYPVALIAVALSLLARGLLRHKLYNY